MKPILKSLLLKVSPALGAAALVPLMARTDSAATTQPATRPAVPPVTQPAPTQPAPPNNFEKIAGERG